jgi:CRISPR-associated endonuclease/helicase Cas3
MLGRKEIQYDEFFTQATGFSKPYDYQRQLALANELPNVLSIPTGVGKTAAIILAWLFRRFFHPDARVRNATPRRLVYCLPMRTLVEQTAEAVERWLKNLAEHDSEFRDKAVFVHMLMGGADTTDWDEHPEREAILIGTQDMLLSRALNRGYGMSRYRWPMHFALTNNDCLWVFDETQLMGVGLTTSAQLQGLRQKLEVYGAAQSLWMSATLDGRRLSTVDHPLPTAGWSRHELGPEDRGDESVRRLIEAKKPCRNAEVQITPDSIKRGYDTSLAAEIITAHRAGTLTLAVVNRVDRAQSVFSVLRKQLEKTGDGAELYLLHSRFRKCDRDEQQKEALDETTIAPDGPGRIVIATQAIEAGVDISATTLFTELAPWSSLVQRFGRCNRRGKCGIEDNPDAQVLWIDMDTSDAKLALPYAVEELDAARKHLTALTDVGPTSLESVVHEEPQRIDHTLRRKDLLELWDTTPDLAGNDLDVSRYIRDGDDTDVQFYWREWDRKERNGTPPDPKDAEGQLVFPAASREELCSVSIGRARDFVRKLKDVRVWMWDPLGRDPLDRDLPEHDPRGGSWRRLNWNEIRPGMVLLCHVDAGGYDAKLGWTGDSKDRADPREPRELSEPDANDADRFGTEPVELRQHLQKVAVEVQVIKERLNGLLDGVPWKSILTAALWHDVGKAHPAFQAAMHDSDKVQAEDAGQEKLWAKSGGQGIPNYRVVEQDDEGNTCEDHRRGFRHELASALTWLNHAKGETDADLIAFLIAAHHGKVRGSIRSLPNEAPPRDPNILFARGLRDGDPMPTIDMGNGEVSEAFSVNLSLMQLGESEAGEPSWLARVLRLRDKYGPFRLAYLETLVRLADWRGSNEGGNSNG